MCFIPFSVVPVNFPRFFGYSHMTFEPMKNSFQTFQISFEFKVKHHVFFLPQMIFLFHKRGGVLNRFSVVQADSEDGLLLYCGENERGRGDFTSLALVRGKLHYR